jgi:hypothetical protein
MCVGYSVKIDDTSTALIGYGPLRAQERLLSVTLLPGRNVCRQDLEQLTRRLGKVNG